MRFVTEGLICEAVMLKSGGGIESEDELSFHLYSFL